MANKGCAICGKKVDVVNGGCAIMLAFCRKHSTNLINVSYCADCYDALLKKKFIAFADSACLDIFDMGEDHNDEE